MKTEPRCSILAPSSAITAGFIQKLRLPSIGKRPVMVATEQRLVDFFVFRLALFSDSGDESSGFRWPHIFAETEGFEIRQSYNFDVLLGMDVLRHCDLTVDRSGSWKLDFG